MWLAPHRNRAHGDAGAAMMHGNSFMLTSAEWLRLNQEWNRGKSEPEAKHEPEPVKQRPCYCCLRAESFLTLECGVDVCATCICRYIRSDE